MPGCCAYGCSVGDKTAKERGLTFHRFPLKDPGRLKAWIQRIRRENFKPKASSRICSLHFEEADFVRPFSLEKLDTAYRRTLKLSAIPSVFCFSKPAVEKRVAVARKEHREALRDAFRNYDYEQHELPQTLPCNAVGEENENVPLPMELADNAVEDEMTPYEDEADVLCDDRNKQDSEITPSTSGVVQASQLCAERKNPDSEITPSTTEVMQVSDQFMVSSPHKPVQRELFASGPDASPIKDFSSDEEYEYFDNADESWRPSNDSFTSCETSFMSDDDNQTHLHQQPKHVVFESALDELFRFCSKCGKPVSSLTKHTTGSLLTVKYTCLGNHTVTWHSQPLVRGQPAGNLLIPAAILLTGSSFTDFDNFANSLNISFPSQTTYTDVQNTYLVPSIDAEYNMQQTALSVFFEDKPVFVLGDGRCDSPGYNAKYCSYSIMDEETKLILDFSLIQKTQTTSSVAMEKEAFKKTIDSLEDQGVEVIGVATDRHAGISALIRNEYPELKHEYDMWHSAKSIGKKLSKKATKKETKELMPWVKSIQNHLWYCSATADGDYVTMKEKWMSILNHTSNRHSWIDGEKVTECDHPPLDPAEARKKKWLKPGSSAHKALQSVVLDKKFLKDMQKMTNFKHTSELEVYHGLVLKYCPKRLHYPYETMKARLQLATMDHNENVGRKQAISKDGSLKHAYVYSKVTKAWVVKKMHQQKTYSFRDAIFSDVVSRRSQVEDQINMRDKMVRVDKPNLPRNMAETTKGDKESAILDYCQKKKQDCIMKQPRKQPEPRKLQKQYILM